MAVGVRIVDDREIASLAGRFRGRAHPTDVLAFDYRPIPVPRAAADGGEVEGEIVLSAETARRQARERRVPLAHEMTLLLLHGLLHLRGFGDESPRLWRAMRRAEFETMMRVL